jgi:hypothetical protein
MGRFSTHHISCLERYCWRGIGVLTFRPRIRAQAAARTLLISWFELIEASERHPAFISQFVPHIYFLGLNGLERPSHTPASWGPMRKNLPTGRTPGHPVSQNGGHVIREADANDR